MTAGIETLRRLSEDQIWEGLFARTKKLADGLVDRAQAAGHSVRGTRVGSMLCLFFMDVEPVDWTSVGTSDTGKFGAYFKAMLEEGIYLAPSQFEAGFTSILHDDRVLEETLRAAEASFARIGG
jgi:glutamate-1-semialdehyde 2,1-aminomutase